MKLGCVYLDNGAHINGVLHKSLLSICVSLCVRYRGNECIRNNRIIILRAVFYAVHVVTKESRRLVLPKNYC
jgi:hypothetical protein